VSARITAAPITARVDTATTARVGSALRGLFPDVNPRDYRCCCEACGEPWEACVGMACATCPRYCATCAPADGWTPCCGCGEDFQQNEPGETLCSVCHEDSLRDERDDRAYEEYAGK